MISNCKKILKKIPVHPSFVLLFLWFAFMGKWTDFFIFVGVVLTHEFGHYFVAKKLGYKLDSFFIAPYGVSLSYKENVFENNDELKIALAGPLVNFCLAFLAVALWWFFPETYNHTYVFVSQSLCLGLFNLLPAYPMDGGRVFLSLLGKNISRDKALKIIKILNIIFAGLFFALFFASCAKNFNPTFALTGVFLILGTIQSQYQSKYKLAALLKKKNKSFSRPFVLYASAEQTLGEFLKHIQQNRYTIFYVDFVDGTKVLDEKIILKLTLKYPLFLPLSQIYSKKHT